MSNDIVDILQQIEKNINMYWQTLDDEFLAEANSLARRTRKAIEDGNVRSGSRSPDRENQGS